MYLSSDDRICFSSSEKTASSVCAVMLVDLSLSKTHQTNCTRFPKKPASCNLKIFAYFCVLSSSIPQKSTGTWTRPASPRTNQNTVTCIKHTWFRPEQHFSSVSWVSFKVRYNITVIKMRSLYVYLFGWVSVSTLVQNEQCTNACPFNQTMASIFGLSSFHV